jgi:hypothetical protein
MAWMLRSFTRRPLGSRGAQGTSGTSAGLSGNA